ncbi:MAG TPA: SulP family inorganic anion transporter [Flavobacteriales bacterium]|nr:SulP family inorganic anion transporter [Flavobacteriales bacterium]
MNFNFSNLKGDLFGGVTAGIVALPLAVAFGVTAFADLHELGVENASVIGAQAGLVGAFLIGIVAALLGGTETQISGPTAPMTVVSAGVIVTAFKAVAAANAGMDPETILSLAMPVIIITFLLAGLFQIIFGVSKIGQYIKYIPYPVISGFMSGIGLIIIIGQVFPFFGKSSPSGGAMGVLMGLSDVINDVNWVACSLAAATVAIVYLFPKLTKIIPSALIALVGITAVGYFFLPQGSYGIVGDIPSSLPKLHLDALSGIQLNSIRSIVLPAITLAALGSIDSLLTSVVADNITKTKHNSNRELIGQGIGNMTVALFGGLPGAGATVRTIVNIKAGGKTRISGMLAGIFLFVIMVFLSNLVGLIPKAVLAGILLTVGIGIIDLRGILHIRSVPKADSVIMISVLLLTVFVDLIDAVAVGMILASVIFMKKMGDISEAGSEVLGISDFKRETPWSDEESMPEAISKEVFVKHIEGPLFFGMINEFKRMTASLPDTHVVIIRMEKVPYIDQSGLYALEDAILDLERRDIVVMLTGIQKQPLNMLKAIKIVPDLIPESYLFNDFTACSYFLRLNLKVEGADLTNLVEDLNHRKKSKT